LIFNGQIATLTHGVFMVSLNKRFVKLLASAALAVCVFGGAAFAQTQTAKKETAAVYVYGSHPRQETIKEAVTAYMIKIKKYRMIDLEAIDPALAEMQRQDNIATDQIAQFGYDKGAKWLCFVKLTLDKVSGETVIRITMVETQSKEATDTDIKVLPRGTELDEMLDFIKEMIWEMLGGGFTDRRDGQKYKTVEIGGRTWMAENLNYKTGDSEKSGCYEKSEKNCKKYGRLYTWSAAKSVCPAGFHLPSREEWSDLVKAAGGNTAGTALKSKSGWNYDNGRSGNGTDEFGFSALPGGYRHSGGGFYNAGNYGRWWTATEDDRFYAYYRSMGYGNVRDVREYSGNKSDGQSVRCVAD
jgi:uncharacterized protein (TIGR02145 family)